MTMAHSKRERDGARFVKWTVSGGRLSRDDDEVEEGTEERDCFQMKSFVLDPHQIGFRQHLVLSRS